MKAPTPEERNFLVKATRKYFKGITNGIIIDGVLAGDPLSLKEMGYRVAQGKM